MKKLSLITFGTVLIFSAVYASSNQIVAQKIAESILSNSTELHQETKKSYFFLELIKSFRGSKGEACVAPKDCCLKGVVIDKTSHKVIDPASDKKIITYLPYSITWIDKNFIITNCND